MKFSDLGVSQKFEENLQKIKITDPRPVQEKSVPVILSGKDVCVKAYTGSGKTLSFSIGILEKLDVKKFRIQSLVIAPTRELSNQIATEIRKFAKHIPNLKVLELVGGAPTKRQKHSLSHGAHIIVGTPGRLCHHLREETLDLKNVETVVLDEGDRILEMGFVEDVEEIFKELPKKRQTLIFSATFEEEVLDVSKNFQSSPEFVEVETEESLIQESYIKCEESEKIDSTVKVLEHFQPKKCLIFCNTKIVVKDLTEELMDLGIDVFDLHGDLTQEERTETLIRFKNQSIKVLVSTNLAARGLDISELDLVINYDLAYEDSFHTHRIGRTGRGEAGRAVTILTEDLEKEIDLLDVKDLKGGKFEDAEYFTILIDGGKKDKLRPGDIVGSLTQSVGVNGKAIGDIDILGKDSFVAINKSEKDLFKKVNGLKIKAKKFRFFTLK